MRHLHFADAFGNGRTIDRTITAFTLSVGLAVVEDAQRLLWPLGSAYS
jgi:hypothetical protein